MSEWDLTGFPEQERPFIIGYQRVTATDPLSQRDEPYIYYRFYEDTINQYKKIIFELENEFGKIISELQFRLEEVTNEE